jgi:hypothetical protein
MRHWRDLDNGLEGTMNFFSALAAFGVWPALPVTGRWVLAALGQERPKGLSEWGFRVAVGLAVWSWPLLLLAEFGIYNGALVGLAGWGVCLLVPWWFRLRRRGGQVALPHRGGNAGSDRWPERALGGGLLVAAILYLGFPTESILGGIDEGVYSNTGVFLAKNGHLDVPYPWNNPGERPPGFKKYPGFHQTEPTQTPQFSHLLPTWLAQAWASLGMFGLFRLNGLLALVAMLCFHGVARSFLTPGWAVAATLFLAFNPSQIWLARITLSETLAEVFIWAALWAFCRGEGEGPSAWLGWAAVLAAMAALARIDCFLLVPLCLASHLLTRIATSKELAGKQSSEERLPGLTWSWLYIVGVPALVLVILAYGNFSGRYFRAFSEELLHIALLSVAIAVALVVKIRVGWPRWAWLARLRGTYGLLLGLVLGLTGFAYWVRPWQRQVVLALPDSPAEGLHHYLTLFNLAQYISPWVIWIASLGVVHALWRRFYKGERLSVVPVVIWAGFSLLYLYDPVVHPFHYWAVRRLVPVVIPGYVLFAACGLEGVLHHVRGKARKVVALALGLGTIAFTLAAGGPLFLFAEYRGLTGQIERIAERLPEDAVILLPVVQKGWTRWATPLFVAFDRRIAPMDVRSSRGRKAADRWIRRRHGEGEEVYILFDGKQLPKAWPSMTLIDRYVVRCQLLRQTPFPVPKNIVVFEHRFAFYRLAPSTADSQALRRLSNSAPAKRPRLKVESHKGVISHHRGKAQESPGSARSAPPRASWLTEDCCRVTAGWCPWTRTRHRVGHRPPDPSIRGEEKTGESASKRKFAS